jgi:hypothetical protein
VTEAQQELYEERVAIMIHDGHLSEEEAKRLAMEIVLKGE